MNELLADAKTFMDRYMDPSPGPERIKEMIQGFILENLEMLEQFFTDVKSVSSHKEFSTDSETVLLNYFMTVENTKPAIFETLQDIVCGSVISAMVHSRELFQESGKRFDKTTVFLDSKRAIKEELLDANPCSKIDEEPENSRARYLTVEEQTSLFAVLKDDLGFLNAPITVSLGTGMRKGIELLKLQVGHLNFSSRPVFYPVRGGSAEIPPNWLIVVKGKGNKYRLIPMNSHVRDALFSLCRDRASDEFVFDKDVNEVNDYALRWGFEEACTRAEIAFGETVPGGLNLARPETHVCNATTSKWSSRIRYK